MKRHWISLALLCTLLLLTVAGCGGDEPTPAPEPPAVPSPTVVTKQVATEPIPTPTVPPATATPKPKRPTATDTHIPPAPAPTSTPEAEPQAFVTLVNRADRDICYVFISPSGAAEWGADWLGAEQMITPGASYTFQAPAGRYDVRAEDCGEAALDEQYEVVLEGDLLWTVGQEAPPPVEPTATLIAIEPTPTTEAPPVGPTATAAPLYAQPTPATVNQFLCCGQTAGETTIWSVNYPQGWNATLLPNNPQEFFGVVASEPNGQVAITFIPGSNTEAGHELDTGNVDDFLNRFTAIRQREQPGFQEFRRESVAGLPSARLWVGTWGEGSERGWEAYLVSVDPVPAVAFGLPQGYLMMYGLRAPAREWANGDAIFTKMWDSMKIKRIDGSTSGLPAREPNQKPVMVRWYPKCCDWVAVDADHDDWACPTCGRATELWETPCDIPSN